MSKNSLIHKILFIVEIIKINRMSFMISKYRNYEFIFKLSL